MLLALRSILWAVLLPGVMAGYVPWKYFGLNRASWDVSRPGTLAGALFIVAGTTLLATCIIEFARTGRGTLSPLDPPRRLVIRGPYRYVRNPMYFGVTLIVLGEVLVTRSRGLLLFWALWFLAVNLFVTGYEEPTLRGRFGTSYDQYTRQVGRWMPKWR
jgi:protein-S-isoprenylcysteine O-methyltransferase Ste14